MLDFKLSEGRNISSFFTVVFPESSLASGVDQCHWFADLVKSLQVDYTDSIMRILKGLLFREHSYSLELKLSEGRGFVC